MTHTEICPICNGTGVIDETWVDFTTSTSKKICHGCGGTGWVTVAD